VHRKDGRAEGFGGSGVKFSAEMRGFLSVKPRKKQPELTGRREDRKEVSQYFLPNFPPSDEFIEKCAS
jgi:hypothetical protein